MPFRQDQDQTPACKLGSIALGFYFREAMSGDWKQHCAQRVTQVAMRVGVLCEHV